jgi:hypothetical protein
MWMPPVELLFLEWKSYNRHKDFVTGQKAHAEGLVWAKSAVAGVEAPSGVTWWLPIF